MLNLPGHRGCNCEGPTRRELLRIGSIAMMGLSLGPITGKLMAEILSDEKPSIDLTLLSPDRYL